MLSDIHGISENLKILEKKVILNDFNYIIILGDLFHSAYTKEVDEKVIIKFLDKYKEKLVIVRGNCDNHQDILKIPVKVDEIRYLNIDNYDFYFTHGNVYNYYNNDTFSNGILVYGHEHIPYIKKDSDMIYLNTGSISLPRDEYGKTFAIYEDKKLKIYQLDSLKVIFEETI